MIQLALDHMSERFLLANLLIDLGQLILDEFEFQMKDFGEPETSGSVQSENSVLFLVLFELWTETEMFGALAGVTLLARSVRVLEMLLQLVLAQF